MNEKPNEGAPAAEPAPRAEGAPAPEAAQAAPAPRRPGKRWPVVVGVVAAVLVVAGAGLFVWHEQPSFCAAICHTPMDEYLATYDQEPGQPGIDKWGNEVADTTGLMAVVHNAADVTCMGCHVPTLSEQVGEGLAWLTGDYYYPLDEADLAWLVEPSGRSEDSFCLNEACHANEDGTAMTREDLAALTADQPRNPHMAQHDGTMACSDCHKAHRASVNACSECHSDAVIPEGWMTVKDEKKLPRAA